MALPETCLEAIYLQVHSKITGCCNKTEQRALTLTIDHQSDKRSKHIDVRYNFIRDIISND